MTTVDRINVGRRDRVVTLAHRLCGGDLSGKRIAVRGAAFRAGTDDVRDSPALDVAARLHRLGATVTVYDPIAIDAARASHPHLGYANDPVRAAVGATLLLTMTAWPEFRAIHPELGRRRGLRAPRDRCPERPPRCAMGGSGVDTAPTRPRYWAGQRAAPMTEHKRGRCVAP
ncbi:UDP binding domain-containing protein [Microtetraspora malaysiensis]|uniref:UDP binding domain-containing protein n=1 Tax=Microtetraspora malaysiensis TaxID=161358 RepID=UPI003D8E5018